MIWGHPDHAHILQSMHVPIPLVRKRKRQVLEEEEDISDGECAKMKKEFDGMPTDFVLPEDTTGIFGLRYTCAHHFANIILDLQMKQFHTNIILMIRRCRSNHCGGSRWTTRHAEGT